MLGALRYLLEQSKAADKANRQRTWMNLRYFLKLALRRYSDESGGKSPSTHLTLTSRQTRQKDMYRAIVKAIDSPSKSIRLLTLKVKEPGFSFKPGQWVDFYCPGIDIISGYTITSSPHEAEDKGEFSLSVRYSDYPPTLWLHDKCKVGDEVSVRVGGDFYVDFLSTSPKEPHVLLLVGGGVGINPMTSIIQHYCYLKKNAATFSSTTLPEMVHLFYSAKITCDLVFKDLFKHLAAECPSLKCRYFLTVTKPADSGSLSDASYHRITRKDLSDVIESAKPKCLKCYVCGPPTMIDFITKELQDLKVDPKNIMFERWE